MKVFMTLFAFALALTLGACVEEDPSPVVNDMDVVDSTTTDMTADTAVCPVGSPECSFEDTMEEVDSIDYMEVVADPCGPYYILGEHTWMCCGGGGTSCDDPDNSCVLDPINGECYITCDEITLGYTLKADDSTLNADWEDLPNSFRIGQNITCEPMD